MTDTVAGFVVQSGKNSFLGRSGRFVRHNKGINHAFVHTERVLLIGGDWAEDATYVYPAKYNKETQSTEIKGRGLSFKDFRIDYQTKL